MANTQPYRKRFKQYRLGGTEDLNEWRARFVATMDPTEYAGAIELLGSWSSWEEMKRLWPHFAENILPEWKDEQEVLIRSIAVKTIQSSKNTNDQKWIAEAKWKDKKPGAPTIVEKQRRSIVEDNISGDIERVRSVNGVG